MRTRVGELITVDVDGYTGPVHVRTDGPDGAPALLLVHGFSGSLHWYDRVVPLLADRFRIVRVDLLGHGSTGGPSADAPLQALAVAAVLERLGLAGITAVGHSFGADVAVELAERSPRVTRLVIVTQAPDYSDANLPRGGVIMTLPLVAPALHRGAHALGTGMAYVLVRRGGRRGDLAAQALADFGALRTGMFRVVLVERRDRMAARPLDAQVRDSATQTLVILGGRDHFYGARSEPRYRAAGAQVTVLPDAGHSPLVEAPQRMAELIAEFAGTAGVTR